MADIRIPVAFSTGFHPRDFEDWEYIASADIQKKLYDAESALTRADESVRYFRYRDALNSILATLDALASAHIAGIHVSFSDVFEGECSRFLEGDEAHEADETRGVFLRSKRQDNLLNKTLSFKRSLFQIKKNIKIGDEITKEFLFDLYCDLNNHDATLKYSPLVDYRKKPQVTFMTEDANVEGGSGNYSPPDPLEIPELMDHLLTFCNEDYASPLLQVVIGHFRFEAISPFEYHMDHIGRLLCQTMFFRRGLSQHLICPIALYAARRPGIHANTLFPYRCKDSTFNNNLTSAISNFVNEASLNVIMGVQVTLKLKEVIQSTEDSWEKKLGGVRPDSGLRAILDILPATPLFTEPYMVQRAGRSRTAINAALRQLEQANIIQRTSNARRNRTFEVPSMIDLFKHIRETMLPGGTSSRESFSSDVSDIPAVFRS